MPLPPPAAAPAAESSDLAMRLSGGSAGGRSRRRRQGGREGGEIILSRMAASLCVLAISRENRPSASPRSSALRESGKGGRENGKEDEMSECKDGRTRLLLETSETRPKTCVSGAPHTFLVSCKLGNGPLCAFVLFVAYLFLPRHDHVSPRLSLRASWSNRNPPTVCANLNIVAFSIFVTDSCFPITCTFEHPHKRYAIGRISRSGRGCCIS